MTLNLALEWLVPLITEDDREKDIDMLTDELYDHEFNFNNADPTSGMRCFEACDIREALQEHFRRRKE